MFNAQRDKLLDAIENRATTSFNPSHNYMESYLDDDQLFAPFEKYVLRQRGTVVIETDFIRCTDLIRLRPGAALKYRLNQLGITQKGASRLLKIPGYSLTHIISNDHGLTSSFVMSIEKELRIPREILAPHLFDLRVPLKLYPRGAQREHICTRLWGLRCRATNRSEEDRTRANRHGKRLRNARKRLGLSLGDVGKLVGLTGSYIHRIESGNRVLTPELAHQLGHVLKVKRTKLLPDFFHF